MNDLIYIMAGIAVCSLLIMLLVMLLLFAAHRLIPHGRVKLNINDGERELNVTPGTSLLSTLAGEKIFIPSACGGGGTCGMCKCKVTEGGGDRLPTEMDLVSKAEARDGIRLACQLKVKEDLKMKIPSHVLEIRKQICTVRSNRNLSPFIKELILDLPEGETLDFRAGGYVQVDVPPYVHLPYSSFDIDEEHQNNWARAGVDMHVAHNPELCYRAYSIANDPSENDHVMLNIRIAPPPDPRHPPGICSSYLFNLRPGDQLTMAGPYGDFFAQETEREMCFIGGGAGMAPMRSHIVDQLRRIGTERKITYWYGARSRSDLFYVDEFEQLAREFPNFSFYVALSAPSPDDIWSGPIGFIHQVAFDEYLDTHPDPTEIEYYLCGPPMMLQCTKAMLNQLGVEPDMIRADDFGG